MNLKSKSNMVFIMFIFFIVMLLIYDSYKFEHALNNKSIIEAATTKDSSDDSSSSSVPADEDPTQTDYTQQIKNVSQLGFTSKGTFGALKKNINGLKRVVDGLTKNQKKVVKGGNALGVKLLANTGYKCNDPDGNSQTLYTYLDNSGGDNGLIVEIGNSIEKYTERISGYADALSGSGDSTCREVELNIVTNSGKKKTEKAHIQNSEIDTIDKKNIVNIKAYTSDSSSESFTTMGETNSYEPYVSPQMLQGSDFNRDPIVLIYEISLFTLSAMLLYKFVTKLCKMYK